MVPEKQGKISRKKPFFATGSQTLKRTEDFFLVEWGSEDYLQPTKGPNFREGWATS